MSRNVVILLSDGTRVKAFDTDIEELSKAITQAGRDRRHFQPGANVATIINPAQVTSLHYEDEIE